MTEAETDNMTEGQDWTQAFDKCQEFHNYFLRFCGETFAYRLDNRSTLYSMGSLFDGFARGIFRTAESMARRYITRASLCEDSKLKELILLIINTKAMFYASEDYVIPTESEAITARSFGDIKKPSALIVKALGSYGGYPNTLAVNFDEIKALHWFCEDLENQAHENKNEADVGEVNSLPEADPVGESLMTDGKY